MTRTPWEDATVSVVMLTHVPCAFEEEAWARCAASVLGQDHPVHELIVVRIEPTARRSGSSRLSTTEVVAYRDRPDDDRVRHLAGCYQSRAAGLQAGVEATTGAYILLMVSETAPVIKNATATAQTKEAILETGIAIQVPGYLEAGETVKLDTRECRFISRA